jgi:putative membrane protein
VDCAVSVANLPAYGRICKTRALQGCGARYSGRRSKIGAVPMIKRYSDHAANERTFLAWVRTAIAVMAFGFVIEKFDLFLQALTPQMTQRTLKLLAPHGQRLANAAGLAFIAIGIAMIVLAGLRFAWTAKAIESEATVPSPGERLDLALAGLIALLGVSLFLYMAHAVLPAA